MVYLEPKKYKCPKCGFDMMFSTSHSYAFLPLSTNQNPFCYSCLIKFINDNVPEMELESGDNP